MEVGERIRKAHEMYTLPVQAGRTVDRRDSTRNPLSLGVHPELLVRTGGGSKYHGDNWGDTPHRVECSASEQWGSYEAHPTVSSVRYRNDEEV